MLHWKAFCVNVCVKDTPPPQKKKTVEVLSTPPTFSGKTKSKFDKMTKERDNIKFDRICILVCFTDVYDLNLWIINNRNVVQVSDVAHGSLVCSIYLIKYQPSI